MKDYINHRPKITTKEKINLFRHFMAELTFGFLVMFVIVSMALIIFGLEVK